MTISKTKKISVVAIAALMILAAAAPVSYSETGKMGYVDLRKAFYEYNKTSELEKEINELAEATQEKRNTMVREITRLRDESELLQGDAKERKQAESDNMLRELQQFDHETRENILNKRNEMFQDVVADIQKVVEVIGKKAGYEYILDSRNIMYADEKHDLTQEVINQLNKTQ
jgi:outer membrane protein